MTPAIALNRFLWSLALGMALGLAFDFIRPIRPRFLGDLLFLIFFGFIWLHLAFSICCGDLRMGYLFGLGAGALLWELGPGRVISPIFRHFWRILALPFKKIFKKLKKILKFLYAKRKKSCTIDKN